MEFQRHTCPNCGAHIEVDPGAHHSSCEYCGQAFTVSAPTAAASTRACLKCGFNNASDARYCNDCGESLSSSERVPQMTITIESPAPQATERKTCPFCREDIAAAAIKCKHCNEYLDGRQRPARSAPRLTTAEIARTWAERFFQGHNYTLAQLKPWSDYTPDQAQKIAKALRLQAGENGLAVLNETFWGSAKRGVVLTDQRVVWRIGRNTGDVSLSYLNRVDHQYGWFKPKKLWFNKHELDPTYATQDDLAALCELLQRIVSDRVNRGISQPRRQEVVQRGWGVAMLQRLAAPAQSGGAKGSSFGLGCLLMIGCCCLLPGMLSSSGTKAYTESVRRAKEKSEKQAKARAKRHLDLAQKAAEKNDPVTAWAEADRAAQEYKRANKQHTIKGKFARRLRGEQAVLAAPLLLAQGVEAMKSGRASEGMKLLKRAQRAHADAAAAGKKPSVTLDAIQGAMGEAKLASLPGELEKLAELLEKQDFKLLETRLKRFERSLNELAPKFRDPAALQELRAQLDALKAEAKAESADAERERGPRPRTGINRSVRRVKRELERKHRGWTAKRWSKLAAVGPHWVVDVEMQKGSSKRWFRVWVQQRRITDVRKVSRSQFGKLKR